jgi:hypothetical protein
MVGFCVQALREVGSEFLNETKQASIFVRAIEGFGIF